MALSSLRLRRALTSLSSLRRSLYANTPVSSSAHRLRTAIFAPSPATPHSSSLLLFPSRTFSSSPIPIPESNSSDADDSEINPQDTSFQGCDYNHWLFVINFPKDPKPTPEQMVAKFEEICAKGLNISIEEAKTKIYACSTTSFEGFQAVMSKEEAEKFNNIPEVAFVLADSYLYPETKEYGGDKYVNGQVIRSTPVQHESEPQRFNDGYKSLCHNDREGGPMSDRQGNSPSNHQRPMGGVRNNGDKNVDGQVISSTPVEHESQPQRFNNRDKNPRHNDREGGPMLDRQGNPPPIHQRPIRGLGSKGEKDVNGQVIRSTPVQHESQPPRFNDRDKNRRLNDREGGPLSDRQGNSPSNHQRPMGGVRNNGDKDVNGQVIRSTPVQHESKPPRFNNRDKNHRHNDREGGPMSDRQGNPPFNHQRHMQGVKSYSVPSQNNGPPVQGGRGGPFPNYRSLQDHGQPAGQGESVGPVPSLGDPQNYGRSESIDRRGITSNHNPSQSYGLTGQGDGRGSKFNNWVPQNYGPPAQRGGGPMPSYQNKYNHQQPGHYPREQGDYLQREQRGYAPSGQPDFSGSNHAPVLEVNYGRGTSAPEQREGRGPMPLYQNYYNQWQTGNYPQEQGDNSHREQWGYALPGWRDFNGGNRKYSPVLEANYGQGPSALGQREERVPMLSYEGNYNQLLPGHSNYPQEQRDYPQREQRAYAPPGPRDFNGGNRNYAPVLEANYGQSAPGQREGRYPMFLFEGNHNQQLPGSSYYPEEWGHYPQREQQGFAPGQREEGIPVHSYEGYNNRWQPGNYPQEQGDYSHREQWGYAPPGWRDFNGGNWNYSPVIEANYGLGPSVSGQSEGVAPMLSYEGNYNQWQPGNSIYPQEQGNYPQREQIDYAPPGQSDFGGGNRNCAPMQGVNYGQELSAPEQREGRGPIRRNYGQEPSAPEQRVGRGPMPSYQDNDNQLQLGNYPQEQGDYPQRGYAPSAQRNFTGENRNYGPMQGANYGQGPNGPETDGSSDIPDVLTGRAEEKLTRRGEALTDQGRYGVGNQVGYGFY